MSNIGLSPDTLVRKPPSSRSFAHRELLTGSFWQRIPGYRTIDRATFLDHRFQAKHSITSTAQLHGVLREAVSDGFYSMVEEGLARAPMSVRLSPYVVALIDWDDPKSDPIRRQFLPLASEMLPDHPMARLDSLAERSHSPVPGLVHRYADKALFLTQDRCPVYCRFCTRSYAVGLDAGGVQKDHVGAQRERWEHVFEYLQATPAVEDVVISGGDSYSLRADQVALIGERLLAIPHIRRMRFATKGLAVMPMKVLTDEAWTRALCDVAARGRALHKEVVVHTHFNHPSEITEITREAAARLFEAGVTVRNQCVLLRGVNDDPDTMRLLVKRLGHVNVQPYYVFQHDLVRGVEDMRTTLSAAIELEKQVRGVTAGFQCPAFVLDTPGGGGKRDVHSAEHYDRITGVSVFRSPNVDESAFYLYFDPVDLLPEEGQERWADPAQHDAIVRAALEAARQQ